MQISLAREFYQTNALELAEKLIGKTLVRRVNDVEVSGVITETEAYMGAADRASHAYGGKRTARTETLYLDGGHAYVYLIYGIYSCMNITANSAEIPEAVLIRAVYPISGFDFIYSEYSAKGRRKASAASKNLSELTPKEIYSFTNGPGKLCVSMAIDRFLDKLDMVSDHDFFVKDDGYYTPEVEKSPRIGIDYAGDAANYLWRFTAKHKKGVPVLIKSIK